MDNNFDIQTNIKHNQVGNPLEEIKYLQKQECYVDVI